MEIEDLAYPLVAGVVTTDDPELLEHFLEFYSGRGIRFAEDGRARIFVNPGLNRSVAKDRRVHHILTAFLGGAYGANLRVAPTFTAEPATPRALWGEQNSVRRTSRSFA